MFGSKMSVRQRSGAEKLTTQEKVAQSSNSAVRWVHKTVITARARIRVYQKAEAELLSPPCVQI